MMHFRNWEKRTECRDRIIRNPHSSRHSFLQIYVMIRLETLADADVMLSVIDTKRMKYT